MRSRRLASLAILAAALWAAPVRAQVAWRAFVDGHEVTAAADPRQRSGVVLVDAGALAPLLDAWLELGSRDFVLRGATGEWRGRIGQTWLEAPGRRLDLRTPPLREGAVLRLPVDALAEACGQALSIDPARGEIRLGRSEARAAEADVEGWEAYHLSKSSAELRAQEEDRFPASPLDPERPDVLPPSRATLSTSTTLGYVPGVDAGGGFSAHGVVRDLAIGLDTEYTWGALGPRLPAGRLGLEHPRHHLGLEAGDLAQPWGLARGARAWWMRRENGLALAVAASRPRDRESPARLALDGRLPLLERGELRLAAASDRSRAASGHLRGGPLAISGFWRRVGGDPAADAAGSFASLELPGAIALQGAVGSSGAGPSRARERAVWLRAPLPRRATLSGEISSTLGPSPRDAVAGRVWVNVGQTRGMLGYRGTRLRGTGWRPELLLSWGGRAGRLRMEVQATQPLQQLAGGFRQVTLDLRPTRNSSLELVSDVPNLLSRRRLHLRGTQRLGRGFSVSLEYGDQAPYQSATSVTSQPGWRLLLRRDLSFDTPAGGRTISGTVLDDRGEPVRGAPVRFGPFRTRSADDGRWRFEHVSAGGELWLEREALPLGLGGDESRREVRPGDQVDFDVLRLARVRGTAYVDRNGNRALDAGEGLSGLLICLDDRTTVTASDGSFGFHDVEPGQHRFTLALSRLGRRLAAPGGESGTIAVAPGEVGTLDFRLLERAPEIVFQEEP